MLALQLFTTVINIKVLNYNVRYEVFPAVLLTVQDCSYVTLFHWVSGSQHFQGHHGVFIFKGQVAHRDQLCFLDCLTLDGESTYF